MPHRKSGERTPAQTAALAVVQQKHREAIENERALRSVPVGYSLESLMDGLDARAAIHPRGLAGVAAELHTDRRSLQRWLKGDKIPSAGTMKKMAEVLAIPVPKIVLPDINSDLPIPPAAKRGTSPSPWRQVVAQWHVGDSVEVPHRSVASLRQCAKNAGQTTVSRRQTRLTRRVWRVS